MVEQSAGKRRRARITFRPGPRATSRVDAEDPLVDAANPKAAWLLEVFADGEPLGEWELWHPIDLLSADTLKLLSIERDVAGKPGDQVVARVREQIQLLLPELPAATFELLTHRQLLAIASKAWEEPGEDRKTAAERKEDAANPPAGERAPDSSSRSPLAASAGATAR